MKALIFHADRFGFTIDENIVNETGEGPPRGLPGATVEECLVVLFHVEENDGPKQARQLCKDIRRVANKVGTNRLMVTAFGHLSNSYAPWGVAEGTARLGARGHRAAAGAACR